MAWPGSFLPYLKGQIVGFRAGVRGAIALVSGSGLVVTTSDGAGRTVQTRVFADGDMVTAITPTLIREPSLVDAHLDRLRQRLDESRRVVESVAFFVEWACPALFLVYVGKSLCEMMLEGLWGLVPAFVSGMLRRRLRRLGLRLVGRFLVRG